MELEKKVNTDHEMSNRMRIFFLRSTQTERRKKNLFSKNEGKKEKEMNLLFCLVCHDPLLSLPFSLSLFVLSASLSQCCDISSLFPL